MREETLNLQEAADFLFMSESALRQKVKTGLTKGSKPAKRWVFLKQDLVEFIRSKYTNRVEIPSSDSLKKELQICYTDAKKRGGLGLQHPMDNEYVDLLGLKVES